uniref:Solute carrier family 2, facilitated glucose transporter member 8 n=1 Tax=Phallusia mammillata TaxID=59560 RepID=A0A6F9DT73_9ASCI|nr:solute carrier family 2, facilitated glucose transporter member 8-like [Phallusia mammillata]
MFDFSVLYFIIVECLVHFHFVWKSMDKPLITEDSEGTHLLRPTIIRRQGSNLHLYLSSCGMLLGAVCTGLMLGISSPLIPGIEDDTTASAISIGKREASWIGSLLTLGGIVGGLMAGVMIQSLGRKPTAILTGLPYIGGLLLMSYATNVWMLYAGRFITGIAMSITTLVVPTYISEISTQSLRGLLCSGNQLGITVGVFIAYGFGGIFTWRWLSLAVAFFPLAFTICCLFLPETPRFLLLKNKPEEGAKTLQKLRGKTADVSEELYDLQETIEFSSESEASWKEIVITPSLRIPLLLSLAIMFFQQFSGINSITFYSKNIFQDAGFNSQSQLLMALLLTAGIQIVFTVIACALVDRLGRKVLLSVSGIFMAISIAAFGAYFVVMDDGRKGEFSWLALSSLIVYIATFSLGLGPVPWIIMAELLPLRARGKCGGLVTAFNLLCAFIVTSEFYDLQNAITTQGTFWLFSGVCLLSVFFTVCLLPETKGRSLEDIERHFGRRDSHYPNYSSLDETA